MANAETELHPHEEIVYVYPRLVKVPAESGGRYAVGIDLKWTEAVVNPRDNEQGGAVKLPLGQFFDAHNQFQLVTLPSYLYVGGDLKREGARIHLEADGDELLNAPIDDNYVFSELYQRSPEECFYDGTIAYDCTGSFNLASKVNKRKEKDLLLKYRIQAGGEWRIRSDTVTSEEKITVDLVVLLPLQIEVLETRPDMPLTLSDGRNYIRMTEMSDFGLTGDLFGRDQAEFSGYRITSIQVLGKDMKNTVYAGDLYLRMYDGSLDGSLDKLVKIKADEDFFIDIAGDEIPMPFHPAFAVYLEKPAAGEAVVRIKPKEGEGIDEFSVKLSVDVSGEAEYEQDL
jgi:hypothetical protein